MSPLKVFVVSSNTTQKPRKPKQYLNENKNYFLFQVPFLKMKKEKCNKIMAYETNCNERGYFKLFPQMPKAI